MKKLIIIIFVTIISFGTLLSQNKNKKSSSGSLPSGFGSVQWGDIVSKAKGQVLGKIVFTDDKKIIVSRDGDIEYLYGFFFQDTSVVKGNQKGAGPEGRLFYVSIRFPYLAMEDLRKKIEEKYGSPTGENITKNQGAVLWDSEKTTVIMWVDEYEKRAYCMKITYIGKEISKEVGEYQKKVFSKRELDVIEKLAF